MAIKVGRVPHLNFEPFYIDMERRGVVLRDIALNSVAEAVREGEIDGGPVPLTDSFGMEEYADPVAGFCLAAASRAGSNLLYARKPIDELDSARIATADMERRGVVLRDIALNSVAEVPLTDSFGMEESTPPACSFCRSCWPRSTRSARPNWWAPETSTTP